MQRLSLLAAVLCGAAPLGVSLFRAARTGGDFRMTWMAVAATVFAAGVMSNAVGHRRSRQAVWFQAGVILVVASLLAGGTGSALGATAGPGVWMVAAAFGLSLSAASVLVAYARPSGRG